MISMHYRCKDTYDKDSQFLDPVSQVAILKIINLQSTLVLLKIIKPTFHSKGFKHKTEV